MYNISFEEGLGWKSLWNTTCFFLWVWKNKKVCDSNFVRLFPPDGVIMQYINQCLKSKDQLVPLSRLERLVSMCVGVLQMREG